MKMPAYSLRVLFLAVTAIGGSLAALLRPTEFAAFGLGLAVSISLLAAIACLFGANRSTRGSCLAFVVCTLLLLYQNDGQRKALTALPPFNQALANWLNERFGWAEPKGPPNTWVYWRLGNRIYYEAFNVSGNLRSSGTMSYSKAGKLGIKIDLDNLPEGPPIHATRAALRKIVGLVTALLGGMLAALLAQAGYKRSGCDAVEARPS